MMTEYVVCYEIDYKIVKLMIFQLEKALLEPLLYVVIIVLLEIIFSYIYNCTTSYMQSINIKYQFIGEKILKY